ncbi:MAG: acetolactate synthase large subunit [Gammaproteobacteria bacterium]|nr:acetolactate synthase large subunit [Gammaproteobacteria bacterium]
MNGAESLIQTLVDSGIDVCFTNPGTSEMHFVAALDEVAGMRCVLCLFEGVLSGAADGYARMARKPASTLLHLGPGLGNALANMHNAKKGNVPMLNIVGDHATYHLQYDAPLTSDIEAVATPMSHWVYTSQAPQDIAEDAARAVREAGHNRIATLILPADVSWGDNPNGAAPVATPTAPTRVAGERIAAAAAMLQSGKPTMILFGGGELTATQGILLSKLGQATGARVSTDTFPPRVRRGAGTAKLEKLPYLAELAIDHIKEVENLILLGAKSPVSFFAYPNVESRISAPGCEELDLAHPGDDIEACLQELLAAVGGEDAAPELHPLAVPEPPSGELTAASLGQSLAHHLPENSIVVDEGATTGMYCFPTTETVPPHDWLSLTGGSIGYGLPCAAGAAIACPERKVVCIEGDGSAMYTIQSLWTMARENLDVTVVICNNRKYSILELEFARTGARGGVPGPNAASMLNIGQPDMDFAAMAKGMGVSASRATTAEEFNQQLAEAMSQRSPRLIDAQVPSAWS